MTLLPLNPHPTCALRALVACAALSLAGCGQTQKPAATLTLVAPQPEPIVKTSAVESAPPVKAEPQPDVAITPKKAPSDPKDFEPAVQQVRALEQSADFSRALELVKSIQVNFNDHPEFAETVYDLSTRVAVEKNQADALGFAASSLADPGCAELASQAFQEAGDAGRLVLRNSYAGSSDEMKLLILKKLQAMGDEHVPELVAERLAHDISPELEHTFVEMLQLSLSRLYRPSLPALFAVAKTNPGKHVELIGFLYAAARRANADQPPDFEKLFQDAGAYEFFRAQNLLGTVSKDGLAVCFNFDEGSGTSATNSGTRGGKADVKATWIPGRKDGALKFNGNDEMVTYNDPLLNVGRDDADFTLAFWFYLEKSATGGWRNITHRGTSDDQRTFALWMKPDSDSIHCRISTLGNGNDGVEATNAKIALNAWTHVAYVKRGKMLKIFINGQPDSEAQLGGRVMSNCGPVYIGKDPWYAGPACAIDEYRIYLRALTDGEVRLLSNP